MYRTRFAGTFPLAPAAKENRDKDSLLSYYPRTLRQGKASQFAWMGASCIMIGRIRLHPSTSSGQALRLGRPVAQDRPQKA